jgi:tripartite-type tricarboxylate transporter receptor subunit TctC
MKRIIVSAFVSLVFGLTLAIGAHASSHEFFKGKTIRLVVGNSTGGAMDDWGRFVAHHLGRHIPGSPDVLVQNMPGAGAIVAANYIYNVAQAGWFDPGADQSRQLYRSAYRCEGSKI